VLWRTQGGDVPSDVTLTLTPSKTNHTIHVDGKPLWMMLDDATIAAEPRSYKEGVTDVLLDLVPSGPAAKAVACLERAVRAALLARAGGRRFGDIFLTPASLDMVYQPTVSGGGSMRVKVSDSLVQGYSGKDNTRLSQAQVMELISTPGRSVRVAVTPVFLYNYARRVGIHWRLKQIHFGEWDAGAEDKSVESDWSF
jgi:hypothetical protein